MNNLQRRRRQRIRRQETIRSLRQTGWVWLAFLLLLSWFLWQLPGTQAYFTDQETVHASFRATTFADNLSIAPGKGDVAQIKNEQLSLDFGTRPAGSEKNYSHVLTVTNTGTLTLILRWEFCQVLAGHFRAQQQEIILQPGAVHELDFKLDADPKATPGTYAGSLIISALDGFISAQVPAVLHLRGKDKKTFADTFALSPGPGKSGDSAAGPAASHYAAQACNGLFSLDFGTHYPGSEIFIADLLTVRHTGEIPLILHWQFCDNLAPFFAAGSGAGIDPGAELSLGFQLVTTAEHLPGAYFGFLRLSAMDGLLTAELPARLHIAAAKENEAAAPPQGAAQPGIPPAKPDGSAAQNNQAAAQKETSVPQTSTGSSAVTADGSPDPSVACSPEQGHDVKQAGSHGGQPAGPVAGTAGSRQEAALSNAASSGEGGDAGGS